MNLIGPALVGSGLVERAVELYALVSTLFLPMANSPWFEAVSKKYITEAAAMLPPDVVAAAKTRGRELDLRETAVSLLTELTELGWGAAAQ